MSESQDEGTSESQRTEAEAQETYSIEMVVHLTQTPRHAIGVYCRHGLIAPVTKPDDEGWRFDDEAIRELRRIERLRTAFGLELPALRMVVEMGRELESLRQELRSLRGR